MELMDTSLWIQTYEIKMAIIPTVVLPFTVLGVLLTTLATYVAALFGVELKAEGPKKLLELLLKPRILLSAVLLNLLFVFGYYGYNWFKNYPRFISTIKSNNPIKTLKNNFVYSDSPFEKNIFKILNPTQKIKSTKEVWKQSIKKGGAFGGINLTPHTLIYGSNDGHAYELDKKTGEILRKFYLGTPVSPRPTIFKGHLYLAEGIHQTHHARVYRFDLKTGELKNYFQTLGHIEGHIQIFSYKDKDILFVPSGKGGLYALNAHDLSLFWHANVGHIDAPARANDKGQVFVTTGMEKGEKRENQQAYALDFMTGKNLWVKELPASGWVSSVFYKNQVCFGIGEVYFRQNYGQLTCFDQASGQSLWAINHDSSLIGRPLIVKDNLYLSDFHGGIYAYDLKNKKQIWHLKTKVKRLSYAPVTYSPSGHIVYPTVQEGILFINAQTGNIDANWQPKDLKKDWSITLSAVVVENENTLFTVDWKGQVRKISVEL